jgi:pimeloyl-ACP methyl ester carboxylesterase
MQKRHSLRHLFWRGVVAAGGNVATLVGIYPVGPQIGVALWRAARGRKQPDGLGTAIAAEWAVATLVAAARPLGFFGMPVVRPRARGPRPIIMLHGYAMGRANFVVLATRLSLAGLGPLIGFEYWTLGGVPPASRRLGAFVEELCAKTGVEAVDLVGHSMGGMVARHYTVAGGGAARVRNLVTIGSPHGGTPFSKFGIGRTAVELDADSSFVRGLAGRPLPPSVRATAIWSRADGLVSGRDQAFLAGAEVLEYQDLGHLSLLASRRVAREIVARLKTR